MSDIAFHTATLHFEREKFFLAGFGADKHTLVLGLIDSGSHKLLDTTRGLLVSNPDFSSIKSSLASLDGYKKLTLSVSPEWTFQSIIPTPPQQSESILPDLLKTDLEIMAPTLKKEHWDVAYTPIAVRQDKAPVSLVLGLRGSLKKSIFDGLGLPNSTVVVPGVLSIHRSFLYNHPEQQENNIALLGIYQNILEVSVLRRGVLGFYRLVHFNSSRDIPEKSDDLLNEILSEHVPFVDGIYFYGSLLTKEVVDQSSAILALTVPNVDRFNPFRLVRVDLGERERQFAGRMAHCYGANVGGVLKQTFQFFDIG